MSDRIAISTITASAFAEYIKKSIDEYISEHLLDGGTYEPPKLTETQKQVCLAMADADLNVSQAAKKMYMHRNTFTYHLNRIHQVTGKNPRHFYDLQSLLLEA